MFVALMTIILFFTCSKLRTMTNATHSVFMSVIRDKTTANVSLGSLVVTTTMLVFLKMHGT